MFDASFAVGFFSAFFTINIKRTPYKIKRNIFAEDLIIRDSIADENRVWLECNKVNKSTKFSILWYCGIYVYLCKIFSFK